MLPTTILSRLLIWSAASRAISLHTARAIATPCDRRTVLRKVALVATVVGFSTIVAGWLAFRPDPNALYKILDTKCLAHADRPGEFPPCVEVSQAAGFAILRDRKGSRHFLLMPIEKISGIESERVLSADAPNFFNLAWENRSLIYSGALISDDRILLALNSKSGRTQEQLHIHISCVKTEVKQELLLANGAITELWKPLPGGLLGHDYWARRVTMEQFRKIGPFRLLAFGLPQAANGMGMFSLAMTENNGEVILLATERDLLDFNLASAEELQDQDCAS
ncbi:CDP-diacylglycerol diphosphatase (plasmid) [Rhizobium ruizarguesonis]|nr:CDP-diacylglycerol diphosphatase [Rhizobium ruizarguesonis]